MYNIYKFLGFTCIALGLSACQTTPRSYDGITGYQIESQTASTATLAYTLAGRQNQNLDVKKLQAACAKVLGQTTTYKIKVLSINEIINPQQDSPEYGLPIGNSRTNFGLSHTQELHSDQNRATLQALEARPSTLHVVRYTCSL